MDEKAKLVDYSFSTSESEEEPAPKRKAIGVVRPISQGIPEESPDNPEIPEELNPEIVDIEEQNEEEPIIILSSGTSDSDTISFRIATIFLNIK